VNWYRDYKEQWKEIIETSFYQNVYPAENHDVYSFVGRFCEKNGITLPIPFDVMRRVLGGSAFSVVNWKSKFQFQ